MQTNASSLVYGLGRSLITDQGGNRNSAGSHQKDKGEQDESRKSTVVKTQALGGQDNMKKNKTL